MQKRIAGQHNNNLAYSEVCVVNTVKAGEKTRRFIIAKDYNVEYAELDHNISGRPAVTANNETDFITHTENKAGR